MYDTHTFIQTLKTGLGVNPDHSLLLWTGCPEGEADEAATALHSANRHVIAHWQSAPQQQPAGVDISTATVCFWNLGNLSGNGPSNQELFFENIHGFSGTGAKSGRVEDLCSFSCRPARHTVE